MLSSACFRDLPLTSSKCPAPCAPGEGVVSVPGCSFSGASQSGNPSSPSPCAQMGTPASLYSQLLARASSCPLSLRVQKSPRTSRWKPGASFSPSPCSPLCGLRHTWLSPHPGSAPGLRAFSVLSSSAPGRLSSPSPLSENLMFPRAVSPASACSS